MEKASIQKDFEMIKEFVEQVRLADDFLNEKVQVRFPLLFVIV